MSFIAGYILGSCRSSEVDPRVKKLDAAPYLWNFEIADGWEVRVKIASDVDNLQYIQFGSIHGGIINAAIEWSLYFCVYQNGKFRYATCTPNFLIRKQENYQNGHIPDRLYGVYEYTDFIISSGEMTLRPDSSDFLGLNVSGTYMYNYTSYSWTDDNEMIDEGTTSSLRTFSHSKNDFGGTLYHGCYVVNGGAEDFKNYVCGLYAVCRSLWSQQ